jgi:hypothetical protein
MSSISVAHKVFLEEVLGMSTGYVLDFTRLFPIEGGWVTARAER